MPATLWRGSISFGMVTIPVRLVSAVRTKRVAFNQLDTAIKDEYPVVTDEDLEPLAPVASRQIDLETFVPAADLDPIIFDASYYVLPDRIVKPYASLTQAMAGTSRAGIGRFVMRQKDYLAAIRSDGERLVLSTLVCPDELVDPVSIDDVKLLDSVELSERELRMARTLVDALSEDLDHSLYVDEYRAALEDLVRQRATGRAPSAERVIAAPASVVDLMEALQASLEGAKQARRRHPSARKPAESSRATEPAARARKSRKTA